VTHTPLTTVLAKAIQEELDNAKQSLGVVDVLFGNQNMIPHSPTIVVMSGRKRRELVGVASPGGRVENILTVLIDIHSSKVGSEADERLALEQLAELVEIEIHKDVTVGGRIIHGFVQDWDPGEAFIGDSMFRTVRLTFVGITRTYLS
jgi:hypothetical protein